MTGEAPKRPHSFRPSNTAIVVCCEILGLALMSLGLWLYLPWLGVIAAGLALLAVGWMLKE